MSLRGLLRLCWLSRANLAILSPALVRDGDFPSVWFPWTAFHRTEAARPEIQAPSNQTSRNRACRSLRTTTGEANAV